MTKEPKACAKFRDVGLDKEVGADKIVGHAHKDKCPQCLAVLRYWKREFQMAHELWLRRN